MGDPPGNPPPGGTAECGAPLLRVGIWKLQVHDSDDPPPGWDDVYCVVQADVTHAATIRVTPLMTSLGSGDEHELGVGEGVFWGQQEPVTPGAAMSIIYDCIEGEDTAAYGEMLDALADMLVQVGGTVQSERGWLLPQASDLSSLVLALLATSADDTLFHAEQSIPLGAHMSLTNGGWWSVHKGGVHGPETWDWELHVRAWGCAECGTQ